MISVASYALELPDGWRIPSNEELDFESSRNEFQNKGTYIKADFNSDSIDDYAYLLKNLDGSKEALFVNLSKQGGYQWHKLDELEFKIDAPNLVMIISLLAPSKYETACGKGYFECQPGEPEILETKSNSILYSKFASVASIFYYDIGLKKFKQIWVSD